LLLGALLIAATALFVFGWLANEMLEGDTRIRTILSEMQSIGTRALAYLVSCGDSHSLVRRVVTTLCVLAIAVFLYFRQARTAALLATTMIGMAVLDITLKLAFHRPRPLAYFGPIQPHIVFRAARYGFRLLLWEYCCDSRGTCERTPRKWLHLDGRSAADRDDRILANLSGSALPSDVIAGYCAGAVWVGAVGFSVRFVPTDTRKKRKKWTVESTAKWLRGREVHFG